ncbi:MAG TPA: glycosyl hydrolase family 8 [Acidimicrobiales bacterium]|nr:glycosyl hydrolase family 8 [Acidimicrobiales bacterium]
MRRFPIVAVIATVLLVALMVVVVRARSSDDDTRTTDPGNASRAAARFFAGYVAADGRVTRVDQGGDTVSEGQAYALLLALSTNDATRFATVWRWTAQHLQAPNGLFAWRWKDGRIVDTSSAADADLDIASALMTAARQFGEDQYLVDARRIAVAVLDHETVRVAGRTVVVAGPWAVSDRIVNPSYLARCDYDEIATMTGDARWTDVRRTSFDLLRQFLDAGLPPDWAVVDGAGQPHAIASPDDREHAGRYGLDAARVPARLAVCPEGHELAVMAWQRLRTLDSDGARVAYALDGQTANEGTHPLGLVATSLAAHAAGDEQEAQRRMTAAEALEQRGSTYYGAAWVGLGRQQLAEPGSARVQGGALARSGGVRLDIAGVQAQVASTTSTASASAPTSTSSTSSTSTSTSSSTTSTSTTTSTTTTTPSPTTTQPASEATGRGGDDDGVPSTSADSPRSRTGDLSSPSPRADGLQPGDPVNPRSPEERARRRSGGLILGGFAGVLALASSLGLRERMIVRRRAQA